jgi:hypothetical protein
MLPSKGHKGPETSRTKISEAHARDYTCCGSSIAGRRVILLSQVVLQQLFSAEIR